MRFGVSIGTKASGGKEEAAGLRGAPVHSSIAAAERSESRTAAAESLIGFPLEEEEEEEGEELDEEELEGEE